MRVRVEVKILQTYAGGMRYDCGYTVWLPVTFNTYEDVLFRLVAVVKSTLYVARDAVCAAIPNTKEDFRIFTYNINTIRTYGSVCNA